MWASESFTKKVQGLFSRKVFNVSSQAQIIALRLEIHDPLQGADGLDIIDILSVNTYTDLPSAPAQQTAYFVVTTGHYKSTALLSGATGADYTDCPVTRHQTLGLHDGWNRTEGGNVAPSEKGGSDDTFENSLDRCRSSDRRGGCGRDRRIRGRRRHRGLLNQRGTANPNARAGSSKASAPSGWATTARRRSQSILSCPLCRISSGGSDGD